MTHGSGVDTVYPIFLHMHRKYMLVQVPYVLEHLTVYHAHFCGHHLRWSNLSCIFICHIT